MFHYESGRAAAMESPPRPLNNDSSPTCERVVLLAGRQPLPLSCENPVSPAVESGGHEPEDEEFLFACACENALSKNACGTAERAPSLRAAQGFC